MGVSYIFLALLVGALAVGVLALIWIGLSEWARAWRLSAAAHQLGLKFSHADPFNLNLRYGSFALCSAGHSPRAENVFYGQHGGWYLRAFDYHFEAGHGGHRLRRRYCAIVAETSLSLPEVLLWHEQDSRHMPLAVGDPSVRAGPWLVSAGAASAPAIAAAFAEFGAEPVNIQLSGQSVMLASAKRWAPADFVRRLDQAAAALDRLKQRYPA